MGGYQRVIRKVDPRRLLGSELAQVLMQMQVLMQKLQSDRREMVQSGDLVHQDAAA